MGLYAKHIFPRLMNAMMSGAAFDELRRAVLAGVSGAVLEVGFGTGLNLPHYPPGLTRLTAIDANPGMSALARRRLAASPLQVQHEVLDGERLPMPDASFDHVVCTWTLCSIPRPERALDEMRRVLKPAGRLHFIEHGLSPEPGVQKWQRRLNPLNKVLACGCHLNRDMEALIAGQGFRFETLDKFYQPKEPRFAGYLYQGVAAKA